MRIDAVEKNIYDAFSNNVNVNDKMKELHSGYFSRYTPEYLHSIELDLGVDLQNRLIDGADIQRFEATSYDLLRTMYRGGVLADGTHTLGLKDIGKWKLDKKSPYYDSNLKQQSGYTAEVLSTAKENIVSETTGKGVTTFRADDRPDLFKKNDQYVDKIRVDNKTGEVIERVQTKFVGKDAESCLKKMMSKKYDKYFNDGMVDKMEVPKEYYDGMKKMIPEKISDLEKQLERVKSDGKTEVAERIEQKIERYKKVDSMLEQSNTTRQEAINARKHPQIAMKKMFAKKAIMEGHQAGIESGAIAAGLTATISTVDNVQKYMKGEISAKDAALDIAKDTGTAGALGYGTAFVSTAVTSVMKSSSHQLIKSVATSGVPGIAISFGIDTYDSVIDYAQGNIDSAQLAYDLGEGAVHIAGAMAGAEIASNVGAIVGGTIGSVVPGAGTAVGIVVGKAAGYGVGMVGGMVGCAIASEAYATAVELGTENAGMLAEKAKSAAEGTIQLVKENAPERVDDVRNAVNKYAAKFNLPFSV